MNKQIKSLFTAVPLLLFTAMLAGLLLARILFNAVLPTWSAWGFGFCWGIMAFGYLLRAELFKQIGGFVVAFLAVLMLIGALLPQERVAHYPQMASDELVQKFGSAWNTVYTGDIFKTSSPKQMLIDYGKSLGKLDPFQHGKMILFGLLGFILGICYLFPIEPPWPSSGSQRSKVKRQTSERLIPDLRSPISGKRSGPTYAARFALLFLAGAVFAVQMELLQVLSPTRMVTGRSVLDSCFGLLVGLLFFMPVHFFYAFLAEHRAKGSSRFNILGVGVDAVNMGDCLNLFEEIISGRIEDGSLQRGGSDPRLNHKPQIPIPKRPLPAMTSALGVAGIMEARRNPKMQRILNESVLNVPDGMPLVWLGKLFGYQRIERVYGPDLLRDICAYSASRGWKHFFYGAAPGVVEKLKAELERKHPGIRVAGVYCPPFRPLTPDEEADLIAQVAEAKPDIFWIGISTPKQLYFMDQMRDKLDCKIICPVGYAFDVNAGVQEDAPDWAKYSGFQWLHRAIKQPRLWERYLPDNPRFVVEVLLQILHLKKYPLYRGMTAEQRVNILGVGVNTVNMRSAVDYIYESISSKRDGYVCVTGAHGVLESLHDEELKKIHNRSLLTVPDGMPNVWIGRMYGAAEMGRVYGPDMMAEVCARSVETGETHFLFGATDKTLEKLKESLERRFKGIRIVGTYSPPFRPLTEGEEQDLQQKVSGCKPDFFWVGLSTPKQEKFMAGHCSKEKGGKYPLDTGVMVGVGAAFDFHAGNMKDAPQWIKNIGMQWFYRLCSEPRRLWKRYGYIVPAFMWFNALQYFKCRKYNLTDNSQGDFGRTTKPLDGKSKR